MSDEEETFYEDEIERLKRERDYFKDMYESYKSMFQEVGK